MSEKDNEDSIKDNQDEYSQDYLDVDYYFKKVVDDAEKERISKEYSQNENYDREERNINTQTNEVVCDVYATPEYNDISDSGESSSGQSMSYIDVDAYFKEQIDAEKMLSAKPTVKDIDPIYNAPQQRTDGRDIGDEYSDSYNHNQFSGDGSGYRPILDEIIAGSQNSVSADKLSIPKIILKPSEDIALMQNLESGLNILKAELKARNYNLRPYTKFNSSITYYENSHIFTSRIRLEASFYSILIMLVQVFAAFFIVNTIFPQKIIYYYIGAAVLGFIFLINMAFSLLFFGHKKLDRYNFKTSFLTALIVIFPAIVLITLYALFIKKIALASLQDWIYIVIYPSIVVLNLLVYVVMYNLVYRSGRHHLK